MLHSDDKFYSWIQIVDRLAQGNVSNWGDILFLKSIFNQVGRESPMRDKRSRRREQRQRTEIHSVSSYSSEHEGEDL